MNNLNIYYKKTFNDINDFIDFFMDKVKLYIKVDYDFEDDIIRTLILASISELESKVAYKFSDLELEEISRAELYLLAFISQAYNNRDLTIEATKSNVNRMFSSILTSLKYKNRGASNES
ncbi:head-tail connector protein [Clostridium tertium]|uniref:head-tail connector protein n=1 Tax=Clostridium tertium TaxID=1559 RepID=UPI0024B35F41|nr:head-tail connector protein [Clostridium tertium]MDI9216001.1 head-tail connector protein [Clostridium tertium]